ncbi:MAG: DUF721 domain-containing protein [Magnetococcales bacterium]|nr:DUF721 domain-containing protein [Magnetococcales bacterium]
MAVAPRQRSAGVGRGGRRLKAPSAFSEGGRVAASVDPSPSEAGGGVRKGDASPEARRPPGQPQEVGVILAAWGGAPWRDHPCGRAQALDEAWRRAAGESLAARAEPVRLLEGVLTLRVNSPVWRTQLQFMEPDLLERLIPLLPPDAVLTGLQFRVGRGRLRPPAPPPPAPPLPPPTEEEWRRAAEVTAEVSDGALRELLLRIGARHFARLRSLRKGDASP